MTWKKTGNLWAWSGYEIELCGDYSVTERYELWCGSKHLGSFVCLGAAKACVYGRELVS